MPCPLQKHHLVLKDKGIVYKKCSKGSLFLLHRPSYRKTATNESLQNACMYRAKGCYEIMAHPIITEIASACCIGRYRKQNNFYTAIKLAKKRQACAMWKKNACKVFQWAFDTPRKRLSAVSCNIAEQSGKTKEKISLFIQKFRLFSDCTMRR